jgi:hypothetical protein
VSFTEQQIEQLLRPINPRRVMHKQGQSHVSQQDIRAHLTRMFGFGGWDKEILELVCVRDERVTVPAKDGKPERKNVPAVTYRCTLRLTVWCPTRCCKKDVPQQESLGDREPDYAEPDPPAPEPERVPAPTSGGAPVVRALLADINRLARVLGLSEGDVRTRMASDRGVTLVTANAAQLEAFRDDLRDEANAKAGAEHAGGGGAYHDGEG